MSAISERIGECWTCQRRDCTHPKVRQNTPAKGCSDWRTLNPRPVVSYELPPPERRVGKGPIASAQK